MPRNFIDGIKRRFRSSSPAPRKTAGDEPLASASQDAGPAINPTQDAEPSTSTQQTTGVHHAPALSDSSSKDREKYGLFRLEIPTTDSPADDAHVDTNSIDIVAVHGLNGTAYGTWTHEKGNFWLEDLAKDFPGARVFTYGYPSEVCFTQGTGNIDTFSRSLLEALKRERKGKNNRRPIIFICHSMGGIVVKKVHSFLPLISSLTENQALVIAKIEDLLFDNIMKHVAGVAFLSTPHRGSSSTTLPLILADVANFTLLGTSRIVGNMRSDLIESLKMDSLSLKEVSTSFRNQTPNMNIASFTEQVITPPAKVRVVDEISGVMDIARERIVPMHGCNHKTICRFGGIVKAIKPFLRYSETGLMILMKVSHVRSSLDCSAVQFVKSYIYTAENKLATSEDLSCLQSLSFPEMNYRRQEADQAYENTCAWILKHSVYTEWLDKNCELLWIQGSPGSGKSTLMSFIHEEFHKNTLPGREVVLDYFFHGRGTTLQKTRVGMFRTLLHQLYDKVHSIRSQIQKAFKEKERFGDTGIGWEWHFKECERLFSEAIVCAARSKSITLFVDALDEAGPDGSDLASYFHELNAKLRAENCNARICISCRNYPVIAPNVSLKVYVEKENKRDINTYIERKFKSEIRSHGMEMSAQEEFERLEVAVMNQSRNIFQWACLVVPLVIKLRRDGQSLAHIMEALDKVPQGLDEVYRHILTEVIEVQYRPKTLLLMQWVCLAKCPLTMGEMWFAMASDDAYVDELRQSCKNSKNYVRSDNGMAALITSMSGGLVETTVHRRNRNRSTSTVQFIHQSVNDFLLSGGLRLLAQLPSPLAWGENKLSWSADSIIGQSHDRLCKSCINYIKIEEVLRIYESNYYRLAERVPFILYAQTYWVFHAERANSYNIPQQHLIERIGLRPHQSLLDLISIYGDYTPPFYQRDGRRTLSLLHIASIANLPSVAIQILETDPFMVSNRDHLGNTPLWYATCHGHCKLVEILLAAEEPIGASSKDSASEVFTFAVSQGHEQVVQQLLSHGVDVRGNTEFAGNALIAAVQSTNQEISRELPWGEVEIIPIVGDVPLLKLLLNHGADANSRGDTNCTAIEEAITSSVTHTRAIKLLLESGANANGNCSYPSAQQSFFTDRLLRYGELLSGNTALYGSPEAASTLLQVAAALRNGQTAGIVTKLLLENGAQVNQGGINGTALKVASASGNIDVVGMLLENGADVDGLMGHSLTPLQEASSRGRLAVVEFLITKGACVNLLQHGSPSALQLAAFLQHNRLVKLLLENGAKVNAPEGRYGTALQAISQSPSTRWALLVDMQLVIELLKNSMEPNEQQISHIAGLRDFSAVETAKLLLDAGADITGPGRLLSELQAASIAGNAGVVELLMERGAGNTELREISGQVLQDLYKEARLVYGPDPNLFAPAAPIDIISPSRDDDDDDDDDFNENEGSDVNSNGNDNNWANEDSPSSQWQRRVGWWVEQQSVHDRY
ncbi:hypothetical protein V496_04071 [Pseudogymnoascus sp. VKM F-4515 (FW-2607)]|nr:hypothetical protein V496_04071 [Pseudogymnoascus sp. VKM F-4515 (FW-2607)]